MVRERPGSLGRPSKLGPWRIVRDGGLVDPGHGGPGRLVAHAPIRQGDTIPRSIGVPRIEPDGDAGALPFPMGCRDPSDLGGWKPRSQAIESPRDRCGMGGSSSWRWDASGIKSSMAPIQVGGRGNWVRRLHVPARLPALRATVLIEAPRFQFTSSANDGQGPGSIVRHGRCCLEFVDGSRFLVVQGTPGP
jgi:hypothetical protein